MTGSLITEPTPEDVDSLLGEAKRRNACLSIYTRCQVAYEGRAQSQLESGDRFVLIKPDGTLLVHGETEHEPRNWQPPGATIQITSTDPLTVTAIRTNPREVVQVTCETVHHTALMPMDDDAALSVHGSEEDLRDRIFETPSLIEDGFRPKERERTTPAGPVDIWGADSDNQPVILELKRRRAGPDAVSQLHRYVKSVDGRVRGILVAPSFTHRAETLLEEYDLESRAVAPPTENECRDQSLTDFVDSEGR